MAAKPQRPDAGRQNASESLIQKLVQIALNLLKKQQRLEKKIEKLEDD
jgi:hypothetical protein